MLRLEDVMSGDDEDFPISYLFYILAAFAVIGVAAVGAFILIVR
jgi:nitrate reductase NapE component